MNFKTRPHFEDRQIVQYIGESVKLSGDTLYANTGGVTIEPTILDFTGATTAQTTVTIAGLTGYLNDNNRLSGLIINPPKLKLSGSTGTTTVNVENFVLKAIDSNGTAVWSPISGVSWSVSACTSPFLTTDIQPCTPGGNITVNAGGFDVNGFLTINDGSQSNGYVFVSDNNGVGSWQPPSTVVSGNTYWELGDGGLNSLKSIYNNHFISSTGSIIGGGDSNYISGGTNENNFIIGGENNSVDGSTGFNSQSGILGGTNNKIFGRVRDSVILGGRENQLSDLYCGILGGRNNSITQEDSVIMGGRNNRVSGFRGAVIAGQNITGTTDDTVYVPNLTVRGDHILHSDKVLEVSNMPSTLENEIKGSFSAFNWTGLTTNILNNSDSLGYTSFLLGDLSSYPTTNRYGFLSYYNTNYVRSGSPTTGNNFYQDKLVLKSANASNGIIFSNEKDSFWWESNGDSRMILTSTGELGIGLNTDGTESPSEKLHVRGDILVENTSGKFLTDIENSGGPLVLISGGTSDLSRFGVITPLSDSITMGIRGVSEVSYPGYGKQGDSYIYSSNQNNGINIISSQGTGTEDYIRFYAGQDANGTTPDLYIQGTGTTRGYVGINTDSPSEKLHVNSGDILVENTNGEFSTDIQNSAGVNVNISAGTNSQLSRITISDVDSGIALGHRGNSEPTFPGYGKQGDGFLYSGNEENGLNIISQPGTGTDDYIRFFVGQAAGASGTPDLYIQGSGTTRGYVGINTDSPTNHLDISNQVGYKGFRIRRSYTPSSSGDTNGEVGTIIWDNNYIYVKTGGGWGRVQLDFAF